MPPKGTSLEEKKQKLLAYMLASGTVFTNKTIESAGKPTGISTMIIKDVLGELLNDDLVDSDKIGSSTYYWAFPSKASQKAQADSERLSLEVKELEERLKKAQEEVSRLQVGREDTDERRTLLERRKKLKASIARQEETLAGIQRNDPERAEAIRQATTTAVTQANLWTDNLYAIQKHLVDKLGMDRRETDKLLGFTEDFDYLE